MGKLDGKVAVITGGTRGFGLAVARAYAEEGATIIVASRSEKSVQQAMKILQDQGARVGGMACDVAVFEQVQALARYAAGSYGGYDVWVNNAGLSAPYGPTAHIALEDFTRVIQTNITGTYYGSVVALRHFVPLGRGKLINLLGRGDREPVALQNAYASSKAWIRNFTRAMALEYRGSGVGIYALNPGLMETEMLDQVEAISGYEERLKPLEFVRRLWSKPPEIPARKAVWLASAATDGRTGLEIRELDFVSILGGLVKEGIRRVTGRPGADIHIQVRTKPAEIPAGLKHP